MTIVCGDSHTATHGAFGALAFGIGTSEVEHVLATQTLPQQPAEVDVGHRRGRAAPDVTAKDVILAIIGEIGTGGGIGHVIEYRGSAIRALSMEGRMTVCNMSIEAGAKAGLIAPDETTFEYLRGRAHAPPGDAWDAAVADWRRCAPTTMPCGTTRSSIDAAAIRPAGQLGHQPGQVAADRRLGAIARRLRQPDQPRDGRPGPRVHGPRRPAPRCATSPSTPCSSGRARTAASRTCGPPPR